MRARLGDVIDDYCVKCKRIMNHSVVSCVGDEPAKVRCRTCHGDHDFRHEQAPPPKIDSRKAALIRQSLLDSAAAAAGATALPETGVSEPAATEAPVTEPATTETPLAEPAREET